MRERFNLDKFNQRNPFQTSKPHYQEVSTKLNGPKKYGGRKGLPVSTVRKAKKMFFEGATLTEISDTLNITTNLVKRLISNPNRPTTNWMMQKEEFQQARVAILVHAMKDDAVNLRDIMRLGTRALRHYLLELNENLAGGKAKLDTKEAKLLSDLIANIHRIESLELNKPTEIIETREFTQQEIQVLIPKVIEELREVDPGISYLPEPEIKQISNDSTNETDPK